MNYATLPSPDVVTKTAAALAANNFTPQIIGTKEEALAAIKEQIPAGASIMNGASRTLEQIGYIDYLKSGQHGWDNLHEKILQQTDKEKQALLRRQSVVSDYYVGSVHALSQTGEMVIASNTGSQMPHLVYTSPNVILVVGTQKIAPTLSDALARLEKYVVPLEDERLMKAYGMHTVHAKTLILHKENTAITGRTVTVLLVNEALGF